MDKIQLCSIAVKNQVISLFGGRLISTYIYPIMMGSSSRQPMTKRSISPAANPKYRNTNTPGYVIIWDEIYTLIHSIFGDLCPANSFNAVGGMQLFELMKLAAHEKNKRNECLLDLSASSQHPWQQPELIERNRECNRDCLLDLSASGQHPFQQPELIERHRDRLLDLSASGKHNFQQTEFIERERKNRSK
jgi:hypothetical protein